MTKFYRKSFFVSNDEKVFLVHGMHSKFLVATQISPLQDEECLNLNRKWDRGILRHQRNDSIRFIKKLFDKNKNSLLYTVFAFKSNNTNLKRIRALY
jgi:hypothetical protein